MRTSGCAAWRLSASRAARRTSTLPSERSVRSSADLHLRVEMIFASAPAHALQALAGGLLLEHRERDELAHAGDFGVERGDFVAGRGRCAIADVRAGVEADERAARRSRRRRRMGSGAIRGNSRMALWRSVVALWRARGRASCGGGFGERSRSRRASSRRSAGAIRCSAFLAAAVASFFHITMSCAQLAQCSQCCSTSAACAGESASCR